MGLVPKLRFPEFREAEEWEVKPFEEGFKRIITKNSENNQNALTISAQLGLVSQLEYFNKKVAAKDLSGYYLLHKGDFAYNKSYSKGYPMGAIKPLKLYPKGVVSTLYICFRTKKGYKDSFYEHYFESGLLNTEIGKIAQEGGRAHGLLNVSIKEFFRNVNIVSPQLEEQQKIADCLSTLDVLIAAQADKLETLKSHKKGLMQQLFPREGESVPRLRFPEFRDAGEWVREKLSGCLEKVIDYRGKAPPKSEFGVPLITAKNVRSGWLDMSCDEYIEEDKYEEWMSKGIPEAGDILFTTEAPLGNVAHFPSTGEFALGQRIITLRSRTKKCLPEFLFQSLLSPRMQKEIDFHSTGSAAKGIKSKVFVGLTFYYPEISEQQKIADCLSSLDALIADQADKLDTLKSHKQGLMQQLFPSPEVVGA